MKDKMLIVKLVSKTTKKVVFERDITLDDEVTLCNFPFSSVIDTLNVLYCKVPHDVVFEISEI